MINLDLSYVIANVLFYMKKLNIDDLNKICFKLEEKDYIVDNSYDNVWRVSNEWKDFFRLENNIITLVSKDRLFEVVFIDALSDDIKHDILYSMIHRNSKQR